ncbi:hypothetical protein Tco_1388100, partial [Tanacetum coccineum]
FGKTLDDPYSRRFDEYKEEFDSEIEQLANKYDLRVGSRYKEEEFEVSLTCFRVVTGEKRLLNRRFARILLLHLSLDEEGSLLF